MRRRIRPWWRTATAVGCWLVVAVVAASPPGDPAWPAHRPAAPGTATVVTFGDSVPAGAACACTPFPDLFARLRNPPAGSVDLAENGFTAADVRAQVDSPQVGTALRRASVVLVMVGANDLTAAFDDALDGDRGGYRPAAQDLTDTLTAALRTIRRVHGGPVPVLVLGYWNVVEDGAVGRADYGAAGVAEAETATRYADDALRTAATRAGARYVPTVDAFAGPDGDPTDLLAADGDHPNARGHEVLARVAYAALPWS